MCEGVQGTPVTMILYRTATPTGCCSVLQCVTTRLTLVCVRVCLCVCVRERRCEKKRERARARMTRSKKFLGRGFSTPYTLFCMICTINSEVTYFLFFTHSSEPGLVYAGF